jgi:GNAT superfamily N-acetyltransferase
MTESVLVRRATPADAADLAAMMSEAFMADPVATWVFPETDMRRKLHPAFFRIFLDLAIDEGVALTTDDQAGVTLWYAFDPAHEPDDPEPFRDLFREALGPYHAGRFLVLDDLMGGNHPHDAAHDYLGFAAVDPDRQGQGIGAALISHRLAELPADLPAYVEASCERNARLYARHGFQHRTPTLDLPDGPSIYPMWRPAP